MYITCPKCSTHFVIKPGQLGKNGRKARCAKCKFVWFATAKEKTKSKPLPIRPEIIPSDNKNSSTPYQSTWLPAVVYSNQKKHDSSYLYKWVIGIIAILALIFTEVIDHGYFGYNSKIMVDNINVTKEHGDHILIDYTIVNNSDHEIELPIIRFRFFDANHKIIHRILIKNDLVKLGRGQSARLQREFKIAAFNSFDITAGSRLDFALNY